MFMSIAVIAEDENRIFIKSAEEFNAYVAENGMPEGLPALENVSCIGSFELLSLLFNEEGKLSQGIYTFRDNPNSPTMVNLSVRNPSALSELLQEIEQQVTLTDDMIDANDMRKASGEKHARAYYIKDGVYYKYNSNLLDSIYWEMDGVLYRVEIDQIDTSRALKESEYLDMTMRLDTSKEYLEKLITGEEPTPPETPAEAPNWLPLAIVIASGVVILSVVFVLINRINARKRGSAE